VDIRRILRWLLGLALVFAMASLIIPIWSYRVLYTGSSQIDLFSYGALVGGSNPTLLGTAGFKWLTDLPTDLSYVHVTFIITTLAIIIPLVIELTKLGHKDSDAIKSRIGTPLLVAGLMSLVSPLVFSYLLPNAINSTNIAPITAQFWGSLSVYGIFVNYGPNVGWYLQFLSLFLIVCSIVAIFQSRRSPTIPVDTQKATVSSIDTQPQTSIPSQEPIPEPDIGRPPILLCGNCRKEIPIDSKLCTYCGTEVKR
jgi:hypothetical protein